VRGEGSFGVASPGVGSSGFRNLAAYRCAVEVADELYAEVGRWRSFERWALGAQLVRAADSIGANVAESCGRWHVPDRRRLLFVARGSLYETEHWVLRAESRGLLTPGHSQRLEETARALNGLIKRPTPG
jgi:four helix bundle protein